jgi:hypothetical protein
VRCGRPPAISAGSRPQGSDIHFAQFLHLRQTNLRIAAKTIVFAELTENNTENNTDQQARIARVSTALCDPITGAFPSLDGHRDGVDSTPAPETMPAADSFPGAFTAATSGKHHSPQPANGLFPKDSLRPLFFAPENPPQDSGRAGVS